MDSALLQILDDDAPYPDPLIDALKRKNRAALLELDRSKADMTLVLGVLAGQQQLIEQLQALATTLGAAIPAAEATHGALYEALAGLSARLAAVEGRALLLTGATRYLPTLAITTGTDYALTWRTPMPDLNYQVVPLHSGGLLGATVTEKAGSRTKTGLTYTVASTSLISVGGTLAAAAGRFA